jgi:hypothetical protein
MLLVRGDNINAFGRGAQFLTDDISVRSQIAADCIHYIIFREHSFSPMFITLR